VRLGNGPALAIPTAGSANVANFQVTDENGAVVQLDFSGYTGVSSSAALSGAGSISIDGTNFTALDLNAADLELSDSSTGRILHVNATGIGRADTDLFSFSGAVNSFDTLQGMIDDLENTQGLDATRLGQRLSSRLSELDRNFENVQAANSALGSRSQRMDSSDSQLGAVGLNLQSLVSDREDVDIASVILDMNQAQQTLQVAQATGARLLQNTLLNYLS
jgi:flagellar hook-associated protein 3 FlgL